MNGRLRIVGLLSLLKNTVAYNWLGPLKKRPALPRALCLYVTYQCNMKCRICGIWRNKPHRSSPELTSEELLQVLADPLFSNLEFININGGEPNLRLDLPDIIQGLIRQFPSLKRLSLNTNGLPSDRVVKNVDLASRLCEAAGIHFSVSVSLHGLGETFDEIAGIKNAFEGVRATFAGIKKIQRVRPFFLSANCVICGLNLDQLDAVRTWGHREGVPVNFALGEVRPRFLNEAMAGDILVPEDGQKKLLRFLRVLALAKKEYLQHALRYASLAEMVRSQKKRTLACHYALGGVVLGSRGELFYCKNSRAIGDARRSSAFDLYYDPANLKFRREEIFGKTCGTCPPYSFNQIEIEKEIFKVMTYLLISS